MNASSSPITPRSVPAACGRYVPVPGGGPASGFGRPGGPTESLACPSVFRMRPRLVVLAALLGAAVLAAGCGGDGSDEASETTTQTTTTTEPTTTAATTETTTMTETTTEDTTTSATTTTSESTETEPELTTSGGATSDVGRFLLRTKRNTILCGRDEDDLVCFVPRSGVTVTLGPRGRPPPAEIKDENRGVPARARSAPVLQKGRPITSGPFRCTLRKGEVRCANATKHGFLLGPKSIFRF
jgi:hypothetical protein